MKNPPNHYSRWEGMRSRCNNVNHPAYHRYGGRGIKVCRTWDKFKNFQEWCLATFQDGKSLDRKNNDKGYSPSNCRWATKRQQSLNAEYTSAKKIALAATRVKLIKSLHARFGNPNTRKIKICSRCQDKLSVNKFTPVIRRGKLTQQGYCRECRNKLRRKTLVKFARPKGREGL